MATVAISMTGSRSHKIQFHSLSVTWEFTACLNHDMIMSTSICRLVRDIRGLIDLFLNITSNRSVSIFMAEALLPLVPTEAEHTHTDCGYEAFPPLV